MQSKKPSTPTPGATTENNKRKSNTPMEDDRSFKTDRQSEGKYTNKTHTVHGNNNNEEYEEEEEEDDRARKILDRSQLMDHMLFPENGPTLVIVPSNKQGTGFLNHCYDE